MEIILILLALVIGYIIGLVHYYYLNRVQCVNCGKHNTEHAVSCYGGEGGVYKYAVKHSEQHVCKDCGKTTYIKMKLIH
jgi:formate dehydrogenase maturation protein FdhE